MDARSRLYVVGALLLLLATLTFGIWIYFLGKPYNNALFTVHKLTGLATAVFSVLFVFRSLKIISPTSVVVIMLIIAALSVLALFTSGALMSSTSTSPLPLRTIHLIATLIFMISCGGAIFQLVSKLR